jgi:PHD/YefM family antitoxin component YafN of YafNO toxin-antitoxin module
MTMDKITIITDQNGIEFVIIDRGNDEYTSMTKAYYDEQQAQQVEHLTEISTGAKEL